MSRYTRPPVAPPPIPPPPGPQTPLRPHRGGTTLTFGIAGVVMAIVGFVPGILSMVLQIGLMGAGGPWGGSAPWGP